MFESLLLSGMIFCSWVERQAVLEQPLETLAT